MRIPQFENINLFPEGLEASPDVYFLNSLRPFFRHKLKMMFDLLPPGDGQGGRALEVGYGCGIALSELAARFDEVVAIDIHPHTESVEQMLELEGIGNVRIHQHDIFTEPLNGIAGGRFDWVFSSSVMEHVEPERLRVGMTHIHEVMNDSGRLVAGFPAKTALSDAMFTIHENTYMKLRAMFAPVSDFSHKTSHPSDHHEIIAAMEGLFAIERQSWFNPLLKVYTGLRCRRLAPVHAAAPEREPALSASGV